ncbi:serine hydrolase [Streptomyces sp. NPDC047315]|uniref:serine hydrolase n=1 Tax=Streptomyces sp. NPDC047315 TaxID=3155142 RepID=UPI0034079987
MPSSGLRTARSKAPRAAARRIVASALATAVLTPALGAATAAPVAAATLPDVSCTASDLPLGYGLLVDIASALGAHESTAAVFVEDRTSGTRCEVRADRAFDSASVVKLIVLGALLREADGQGRRLTDREGALAHAMVTRSDNAATGALWRQLGAGRIAAFCAAADMADTVVDRTGHWGLTQITARDTAALLRLLTTAGPVLSDAARSHALRLMREVVPAQRWGTPAGAPADATVHVKNGWLPRASHGWRVHSAGAFGGAGGGYTVTVLTEDNATMAQGVDTIEAVSRALHRRL